MKIRHRLFGTAVAFASALGLLLGMPATAMARTCHGQISQGFVSPTATHPLSYHLSRNIDNEPGDAEYVFVFSKPWRDGVDYLQWTGTPQMVDMANQHWAGTLGAQSCYGGGKFEVYADAAAVMLSGGPGHWGTYLTVSTSKP